MRPKITFHLSLTAQAFLCKGSACRTLEKNNLWLMKKTLRAILNRRDYCWKSGSLWRKYRFWPKILKERKKSPESLTSQTCGIELKMHKTILGMFNLIRDYWNRKATVHVLKFTEKSISNLAEYSRVVGCTLIHFFFGTVRVCCSSLSRLSKTLLYVVHC